MQQSEIIVNYLADKYDNEPEKKRVKFSSLHWKTNSNVHDTRFSKIGFEYKIYLFKILTDKYADEPEKKRVKSDFLW